MTDAVTATTAAADTTTAADATTAPNTAAALLTGGDVTATTTAELTPEAQAAADLAKAAETPALKMPGKDATPEDWNAFYKQLGRPETADAYELPVPEGDDGKFAAQMKPLLHKHGLSSEQAKGLAADWNAMTSAAQAEQAKAKQDADTAAHAKNTAEAAALTNEWGQSHAANMEFAKRGIAQFIPGDNTQKGAVIAAVEGVLGYKGTIQFFHSIGKGLAEGGAAGLDGSATTGAQPPSLADRLYGGTKT